MFGSAFMFVPVVGHLAVLGPFAAMLYGGLQGTVLVGGASALVGVLSAIGILKDSGLHYKTALQVRKLNVRMKYLVAPVWSISITTALPEPPTFLAYLRCSSGKYHLHSHFNKTLNYI